MSGLKKESIHVGESSRKKIVHAASIRMAITQIVQRGLSKIEGENETFREFRCNMGAYNGTTVDRPNDRSNMPASQMESSASSTALAQDFAAVLVPPACRSDTSMNSHRETN